MYDVLAATAARGDCGLAEWRDYVVTVPLASTSVGTRKPEIEMFDLPPLVRYLYMFGHCLTAEQKSRIETDLSTTPNHVTGHGTLNHAAMQISSWYLLAQYFPSAVWTQPGEKDRRLPSADLMALLKKNLLARNRRFLESGHTEMTSPTYAMVNVFPMLNLVEFSADKSLKASSEAEVELEVMVLRAQSFDGTLVAPLTRRNYEQRNAPETPVDYAPSVAQQLLWYYFGKPEQSAGELEQRREPFYVSMLALSSWRPPLAAYNMPYDRPDGYEAQITIPRFTILDSPGTPDVLGSGFFGPLFALGTVNSYFEPAAFSSGKQGFSLLFKSESPQNQIECFQPYWLSNYGEDAWGAPDRWSPFQQTYRWDKSSAVLFWNVPARDPWVFTDGNGQFKQRDRRADNLLQLMQCRIPRAVDELVEDDGWVFIRHGKVFIAIGVLEGAAGFAPLSGKASPDLARQLKKFQILQVREAQGALFFRVDAATAELDFEAFKKKARAAAPVFDKEKVALRIKEADGSRTDVGFRIFVVPERPGWWASLPKVVRNGRDVSVLDGPVFSSPVLEIKGGALRAGTGAERIVRRGGG